MQPFLTQFIDLLLIQFTNWRWSWRSTLTINIIAPLFLIGALGAFAGADQRASLGYVLTGNLVLTLMLQGLGQVSGYFSFMRLGGGLDYLATLPIYRAALILATVTAFLVLSLPSVTITLILGSLILGLPLTPSPMLLLVIPLISVSLSGLGGLIGLIGETPEQATSLTNILTFVLFGFGPVVIPADRLPPIVNTLSLISPTTYAASALRQVLLSQPDRLPLALDIAVLLVITVVFLWLVTERLDWRARR
jgi:ABC-2 type transport system permease protein